MEDDKIVKEGDVREDFKGMIYVVTYVNPISAYGIYRDGFVDEDTEISKIQNDKLLERWNCWVTAVTLSSPFNKGFDNKKEFQKHQVGIALLLDK